MALLKVGAFLLFFFFYENAIERANNNNVYSSSLLSLHTQRLCGEIKATFFWNGLEPGTKNNNKKTTIKKKQAPFQSKLFKLALPGMGTVSSSYLMAAYQLAHFVVFPLLPTRTHAQTHLHLCWASHSSAQTPAPLLPPLYVLAASNKKRGRGTESQTWPKRQHCALPCALCLHRLLSCATVLFCSLGYSGTQYWSWDGGIERSIEVTLMCNAPWSLPNWKKKNQQQEMSAAQCCLTISFEAFLRHYG